MSPKNWKIRISDILDCIEYIRVYTQDLTLSEFQADQKKLTQFFATWKLSGRRHVTPEEITKRYPDIPWDEMRAMRNIVIHEYFGVNLNIIWHTTQVNLPSI